MAQKRLPKPDEACGCVIAGQIISAEIQKRKHAARLKKLEKKIDKSSARSKKLLRTKHARTTAALKEAESKKKRMHKSFKRHTKKNGYVSPDNRGKNGA